MMKHKFGLIIIAKGFPPLDSKIPLIVITCILQHVYYLRQKLIVGNNNINIKNRFCP